MGGNRAARRRGEVARSLPLERGVCSPWSLVAEVRRHDVCGCHGVHEPCSGTVADSAVCNRLLDAEIARRSLRRELRVRPDEPAGLTAPQARVDAVLGEEDVMAALLDDPSLIHHDNPIHLRDRR